MFVHKVRVWDRMFSNEACDVLNNNKFTFVNACFQHKHNEVRGHYRQTPGSQQPQVQG